LQKTAYELHAFPPHGIQRTEPSDLIDRITHGSTPKYLCYVHLCSQEGDGSGDENILWHPVSPGPLYTADYVGVVVVVVNLPLFQTVHILNQCTSFSHWNITVPTYCPGRTFCRRALRLARNSMRIFGYGIVKLQN